MKKTLVTILGILIGFVGFSYAQNSCYDKDGTIFISRYYNTGTYIIFHLNTGGVYNINSFSVYFGAYGWDYSKVILDEYCLVSSSNFNIINCNSIPSFTSDGTTFTFSSGLLVDGFVYSDIILPFHYINGEQQRFNTNRYDNNDNIGVVNFGTNLSLFNQKLNYGNTFSFTIPSIYSSAGTYRKGPLRVDNVCYDYSSEPLSVINTLNIRSSNGNIMSTIEVEDGGVIELFINSPVIRNSENVFQYDGTTSINLFYNDSSFSYDKNQLYLNGGFWFKNNVFTPICL